MMDRKNGFLRTAALFMSAVIITGSGAFAVPSLEAEAAVMKNQDGVYLNEALSCSGNGNFTESRDQWLMTLDKYSVTDFYIGTPFKEYFRLYGSFDVSGIGSCPHTQPLQ